MIKKTIQYETPDGENVVEDFYFHVSKDELLDLNLRDNKGIEQIGKELAETQDGEKAWHLLKDLLLTTYGKRTADGKGFDKEDPITGAPYWREFKAKAAFGNLIIELMQDTQGAIEFFNALVPQGMKAEIEKAEAERAAKPAPDVEIIAGEAVTVTPVAPEPDPERTVEEYTEAELLEMSNENFEKLVGKDTKAWSHRTLTIAFQRKNRG